MSAKAKTKLTPQQRKATLTRVLGKIKPYSLFVVCSLVVAAVSVGAQLYIATINKFFENSLNVSETSRQLYIHRNTLASVLASRAMLVSLLCWSRISLSFLCAAKHRSPR